MMTNQQHRDFPPNPAERDGYRLVFDENFTSPEINTSRWFPYYLPQWSSKEKSKPSYKIANGHLTLTITPEQAPWCPEFNGQVKCSSIQTGVYSGSLGSPNGQHRFNSACRVREEQKMLKLYTPQYGYFEIRAKAKIGSNHVAAFWLIGFEDTPEKSGEICIMELKGKNVSNNSCINGYGIHPFGDDDLTDQFFEDRFEIAADHFNIYAVEWKPEEVRFFLNNQLVRSISQSPAYDMQLMLNIYELHPSPTDSKQSPPELVVDYIRGYQERASE